MGNICTILVGGDEVNLFSVGGVSAGLRVVVIHIIHGCFGPADGTTGTQYKTHHQGDQDSLSHQNSFLINL